VGWWEGAVSYQQLHEDQDTVRALDEAVAAFKASLGSDDVWDVFRARTKVYDALLACVFRAGDSRRERARGGEGGADGKEATTDG
jgi:hypothetical protein